jgi:hypothetical protein
MVGLTSGVVQLFLAWRVQILTERWWIVGIIALFSVTSIGTSVAAGLLTILRPRPLSKLQDFRVRVSRFGRG